MHPDVGRIAPLRMRVMSLYESRESNGAVSLAGLFEGKTDIGALADFDVEGIAYALCRGGWPETVLEPDEDVALMQAGNYIEELVTSDIEEMDGARRSATWLRSIMRSYARNTSCEAALTTIAADMQGEPPSFNTVSDYVDALARATVVEDLEAWSPRLRSKTAVRTSPTRHFSDPSLAAVLALPNGRWAPVEVKMGHSRIDEGVKHLLKLADRVDAEHEGAPAFLMVLTATEAAYRRGDGVFVVPLACLAP